MGDNLQDKPLINVMDNEKNDDKHNVKVFSFTYQLKRNKL